jgi:hypothetical protein
VLGLEVVVHEHDVRKALTCERRADVDDDRLERLFAHVDRPGEPGAVAGDGVRERRQDEHP